MIKGRIIKGVGGLYTVAADDGLYFCKARGVFRKRNVVPLVGDYVFIEPAGDESRSGTIAKFAERSTELIRPRVANVDQVVVVFATHPDVNPDMLDRFLILAEERGLEATVCINKIDLAGDKLSDYGELIHQYSGIGYRVEAVSAKTHAGLETLRAALDNRVSVFAGPSGVGKSSLVNALFADDKMDTGELSRKLGRGKHTTRHAELMELERGTFVVDTPGFTTLELTHVAAAELPGLFREFRPYLASCRFSDCRHMAEPDCAVKAEVGAAISPERYARYVNIRNELESGYV